MKHEILVVESDEPLRWLLDRILKDKFKVSMAKDSLSAIAWLSGGNLPSLILCDLDLPEIDGLIFLENLNKSGAYSEIPVVMFSSSPDESIRDQSLKAGASAFLKKPFDPLKLIEVINKVLKGNEKTVV